MSGQRLSDTTPPQPPTSSFKTLMNEMAELFPRLPQKYQDQAREAHSHVQVIMREGETDQAVSLMTHMRDIMKSLLVYDQPPPPPAPPLPFVSSSDMSPAIPPLPPGTSPELVALQRSLEDLQMRMKENSSINLIAKRVRDMDMEQKYFQLEERLNTLKQSVQTRLSSIAVLADSAASLARREARKRTVSKNPFCEHEASGFCEFCVGREIEEPALAACRDSLAASPPMLSGTLKEDLANKEMVIQMQQTLKSYQGTLKELLEQRKQELLLNSAKTKNT